MNAAATTMERHRAWRGPALLSFGFRPFFLLGALWAALAMALWVAMLAGELTLPTAFDPVSWHAHEFLFGYLGAIIAGFLLTAVPNWTGRLPVTGWPLAGLVAAWLAGRVAVSVSQGLAPLAVAAADLALVAALAVLLVREIIVGRNWRNLPVVGLLVLFGCANALFHSEAASGVYAAQGMGLRLGLSAVLMMIAVIGGRIVPSFTRNWLTRQGAGRLPVPPMQSFDLAALGVLLAALLAWVVAPFAAFTGMALALAGGLHLARMARWAGDRTFAEPLVTVLHVGYAFVPLGALVGAVEILGYGWIGPGSAQHLWTAGGLGLMTLAVMTRATLGHTGRALTAGRGTMAIYAAVVVAVLARIAAGAWPEAADALHSLSGMCWIGAFAGFAALYGPMLLRPRQAAG
ncbi:short-chain dehydrogenase [Porphyrobacter sp. TH134]|uniref:NnrS family protein n=1 Tax=Porphyrobacter sp. TH134 TaxID=2067450 RepID=UPI000C7E3654|nr:NnrS family protein [Porphyrobacter sp. TH134]PLK22782.1 short-chain dehydrogenase [Porphyrobacter sp. TH134]